MAELEIERKFLLEPIRVECFLKINGFSYEVLEIEQFYIERKGKLGRIRKVNDKYYLTLKKGEGLVREEYESEIEQSVFENILAKDKPVGSLNKLRYKVPIDSYEYEVDEFKGNLNGLVMLEVEFDSEAEARSFKLNEKFKKLVLAEVTGKVAFLNETIAVENLKSRLSCEDVYKRIELL